MCRSRTSSAAPRSSSSRFTRASTPGGVALAMVGALGSAVHDRTMSRRPNRQTVAIPSSARSSSSRRAEPVQHRAAADQRGRAAARQSDASAGAAGTGRIRRAHRLSFQGPRSARAGAHAYFRADRRPQPLPAAISGWNFSAITCSAWSSPTCCSARFAKADEGEMSRRLADLVRKEACADVARAIELGAAIRLGASEANAGGRNRTAILADVCEALIGAVFIDGGYPAASDVDRAAVGASACARRRGRCAIPRPCCRNGRRRAVCRRRPIGRSSARAPTTIRSSASPSSLPDLAPAEGLGRSKRAAEQAAAAAMLTRGRAGRSMAEANAATALDTEVRGGPCSPAAAGHLSLSRSSARPMSANRR